MIRKRITRSELVLTRTPALPLGAVDVFRDAPTPTAALELLDEERARLARQAIQLASPRLYEADRTPLTERALERSLYRMTTRATPFGLHAACSMGRVRERTEISLAGPTGMSVYCTPNFQALVAAERALRAPGKETLIVNPTTRRGRKTYTFVRRRTRGYEFEWGVLHKSPVVDLVWAWCAGDWRALVSHLAAELNIGEADAEARVSELVDSDYLRIGPSRVSMLGHHRAQLPLPVQRGPSLVPWVEFDVEAEISRVHSLFSGSSGSCPPDAGPYAVLWRGAERCAIGETDLRRIERATEVLHELGMARSSKASDVLFDQFTHRFGYESVPLLDVVDPSSGLEALLWGDGLEGSEPTEKSTVEMLPIHEELADRLDQAEIVISEELVEQCRRRPTKPLPDSLLVHGELWTRGDRVVPMLRTASGPPGSALLGRFASASPTFEQELRRWCELEDRGVSGASLEVFHVPFPGVGNVSVRPMFRAHAVGVDGERRGVDLQALELCAGDGELILWTRELGRLYPRTTTAMVVDFRHATSPIYKLLAMIQAHGVLGYLAWDWGPFKRVRSLPRVVHRGVVLAPRQWGISDRAFDRDLRDHVAAGLPRLVTVDEAKGPLTIDMENPRSVAELARIVRKQGRVTLAELGPPGATGAARCGSDHYVTEILVPYLCREGKQREFVPGTMPIRQRPGPTHLPGGGYLTLKLYAGPRGLDALATKAPFLLLSRLRAHAIEHWHFLRFGDPETHIRLRMRGDFRGLRFGELHAVLEQLREECSYRRVSIDGYAPEFGRYGGPEAMSLAERVFFTDSVAAVAVINSQALIEERRERELAMLKVTERLIGCLVPLEECVGLCESLLQHYGGPRAASLARKQARRALASWARDWQGTEVRGLSLGPVSHALDARDQAARDYGRATRRLVANVEYRRLCTGSIVHMQVNRYSEDGDRSQELLIYELVRRAFRRAESVR